MRRPVFATFGSCAALAAGEALGAASPACAPSWPVSLCAAILTLLFGYGFCVRGWWFLFVALAGLSLSHHASLERELTLRETPWLRTRPARRASAPARPTFRFLEPVRRDLSRRLAIGLDHDRDLVSLNRAILLGERTRLPQSTRRLFVDAGTIHVFAISGLHVMIVAHVLAFLALFVPFRYACLAVLPVLWGYVFVIGSPPSAIRAGLMASFSLSAPLFLRRPDGLVAWALAFLIVHLASPLMIANVGSLLSFTVMLAILLAVRASAHLPTWAQGAAVSFAAWSAGVPIAAHVFGRVTPGGLLANLALIPAATVTVVSGVLGILASFISDTLAAHLNNLSALFTGAMVEISRVVSLLPGAHFETRRWTPFECALWYAATILIFGFIAWRASRRRCL